MEGVPRLAAPPEMRIDGYEADLVPINWLGVSRDGTVAILQAQDLVVRFFDPSGTPIGALGGEGGGPGEFRSLVRAGWKADTLWVSDPMLARVTLISPDRAFLRTLPPLTVVRPLPEDSSALPTFGFVFPYAVYEGDSMLVAAQSGDPRAEALGGMPLLRVSQEGWIRRVVTLVPHSEGALNIPLPDGGIGVAHVPYFPDPQWAVSPDGRVIAIVNTTLRGADQGSIPVGAVSDQGAELFKKEFPFEGVPIPRHVADSVLRVRAERARIPEVKRAYESDVRGLVPPVYPPVRDLIVGDDHRIWIGLRATEQGRPWLVLDQGGAAAGIVILPRNSSVRAANGDYVWAVERDEFDVESVVRYRLRH
jgi:hypothetical protein